MNDHPDVADAATTEGLPVAPSLGPALEAMRVRRQHLGRGAEITA